MRFGIGVPTLGARPLTGYWEHNTHPTLVHVTYDHDRRGPGWARNQALAHLYDAGCDIICLFDDDARPTRPGWQDYLLANPGWDHLVLHNPAFPLERTTEDLAITQFGIGAFYALTRQAVETVGYFSAAFRGYGFEDVHYRHRLARAHGGNVTLTRLAEWVESDDLNKPATFNQFANMPQSEKDAHIARNAPIYRAELADPRLYRDRDGR